ncbi:PrsW family glutamic-type intramembrane protease [Haliscomenobacter sp.]|uniref:PrsW family intramembrane metalloprotease n=1 Tax=Haliscomenobacter sp. TaxID=2717303 RepID=UPI003364D0AA
MVIQLALAIFPTILIAWVIYRSDRYEREKWLPLTLCFILGMVITFPVMRVQEVFYVWGIDDPGNIFWLCFTSFLVVSFTEELFKFLALVLFPYLRPFFNEPLDGIIYAVMISMGFATLENILYALEFGISTTALRGLTAVPAHAVFATMMGYFVGKSKFKTDHKTRIRFLLMGLSIAVLVHGLYDFFIIQEFYDWLMLLAIVTLLVSIFFAVRMFKEEQAESAILWDKKLPKTPVDESEEIESTPK